MQSRENIQLCITADRVRETVKHPEIQIADEAFTDKLGATIADALRLRRDSEHRDRWQTSYGSKTNKGLARMLVSIL